MSSRKASQPETEFRPGLPRGHGCTGIGILGRHMRMEIPLGYRSGIGMLRSTETAVTAFCGLPSITRSL